MFWIFVRIASWSNFEKNNMFWIFVRIASWSNFEKKTICFGYLLELPHGVTLKKTICFGYLLELPHGGNSNKYPKHMICIEISIKPFLTYHSVGFKGYLQLHFDCNIFGNK